MEKKTSVGYFLFENILSIISTNFKITDQNLFELFQKGTHHYKQFVFLQDQIVDQEVNWVEQFENSKNILFKSNSNYQNSFFQLINIFPQNHQFWKYLKIEEKLYYDFIIKEKYLNAKRSEVTIADFEEMTYSKHNLALVPIKGMEWLFESRISYEDIKSMFICIFNGMQMLDDIDDFSKDLKSGQWNLIQYEVQKIIIQESLIDDGSLHQFEERVFYASGICNTYSEYALFQYQKAAALSEEFGFDSLKNWLDQVIAEVVESIKLINVISS